MPRATNAVARHRAHKRFFKRAKGYRGGRSKLLRTVKESLVRAEAYSRRDRRTRKRDFRRLWITRISAACRARGITYSVFVNGMSKAEITLDRKVLSDVAVHDPAAFDSIVDQVKAAMA
ncbi:MAG: 50S ribosomal protein L20 [Planctomycetes bacterium]|nr:50S ribosomal protein L20 [Planctomycetota bacterium]